MRIGIEAQRIFRTKKHGMDIVALELIKAIQKCDLVNEYFIFVRKGEDMSCLEETSNVKIVIVPGITYTDWEQIFLPIYARKCKIDILHSTSNTAPIMYAGKTVITLHDVIFLEPNQMASTASFYQNLGKVYRKYIVPKVIRKANHVITVSNFERERIHSLMSIDLKKISVVYNSFGNHFSDIVHEGKAKEIRTKYKLPKEYIFYIGNTDPKKNIVTTMRAYLKYCMMVAEPLPLVIADISESFLDAVLKESNTKSLRNKIQLTGYIDNADLPSIYASATLFLYLSLRESFGIPLLESMASGTPVISSYNSALPEIAGDAAVYVNPTDEKNIGQAMANILGDSALVARLKQKGFERVLHFDWSFSASKLISLYTSI